jgi:hypothetical protein
MITVMLRENFAVICVLEIYYLCLREVGPSCRAELTEVLKHPAADGAMSGGDVWGSDQQGE